MTPISIKFLCITDSLTQHTTTKPHKELNDDHQCGLPICSDLCAGWRLRRIHVWARLEGSWCAFVYWSAKRRTRVFSRFCAHAVTRELSCGGTADLEQFTSSKITGKRMRKVADLRIGKIPNADHLFTPILLQGTLFHPTIRSLGI